MSRIYLCAIALVLSVGFVSEAHAQAPGRREQGVGNPYYRPPVSPYLNLLRNGGSVTSNYFNLVKPQIDFRQGLQEDRQAIGNLQKETRSLQKEQQDVRTYLQRQAAGSTLNATGHSVSRMTHSKYFGVRR